MKKSIFALLALCFAAVSASAQVKIVTVSVQQCFDGYYKTVDFRDRMNSVQENLRAQVRERETTLQTEASALQAKVQEIQENPGLADTAKEEQLRALQPEVDAYRQKEREHQQWAQGKAQEAQQQVMTLRQTLLDDIKRIAVEVAIRDGADIVLDSSDSSQTGVPAVLYSSTSIDITNKVLNELNKDRPAE